MMTNKRQDVSKQIHTNRKKVAKKPVVQDAGVVNGVRLTIVNGMVFATPAKKEVK